MTVDSETSAEPRPTRIPPSADQKWGIAGLALMRLTLLPAMVALAFLLVSFPLLLLGWFRPAPVIASWAVATVIVVPLWWRFAGPPREPGPEPVPSGGDAKAASPARPRIPWWPVAAMAVIAVGFGIFQALYHTQMLVVTRDPASYMNFALWIQRHGSLPIPADAAAFGGAGSGPDRLQFASYAYYQVGNTIVPQFMAGMPMVMAVGYWVTGGITGAYLMAPLLGALAVFTFGGLVARLVGARWAVLATLAVALSLPMMYTSRETFSEPLSEILFIGGLSLLVDALRAEGKRAQRVLAALSGLCLGIVFVVRLDGPSDILMVVPYCGFLFLLRKPQALPLGIGTFIGLAYGLVDCLVLTRPYAVVTNISSTKPLAEIFAVLTVLTVLAVVAGVVLRRRGRTWPAIPGWLSNVAAFLPFIVIGLFALRPYVETDERALADAPLSLHWVYWYAGGPVIVAAAIGAGLLLRRLLRGQHQDWLGPFLVLTWAMIEFLYRPGISFDQPWGSRRLVPAVLPGFLLFATWLAAWAVRQARTRLRAAPARRYAAAGLTAVAVLAMLVPISLTTFHSDGWATTKLYTGETAAVYGICGQLPPNADILIVGQGQMGYMGEPLRGICNVPVAGLPDGISATGVESVIKRIKGVGRQPVVMASDQKTLQSLTPNNNGVLKQVMALNDRGDAFALGRPPTGSKSFAWYLWMWESK
jgi:hypothetical protein